MNTDITGTLDLSPNYPREQVTCTCAYSVYTHTHIYIIITSQPMAITLIFNFRQT